MPIAQLSRFYEQIREDNRITTAHISLYMALLERWNQADFTGPVVFTRRELMAAAKISGLATYHRCIRDLARFGYIDYHPSYHPARGSQVVFL